MKIKTFSTFIFCLLTFVILSGGEECFSQSQLYTVVVGDTSILSVTGANGSIQWQQSTDSLTWADIAGATNNPQYIITTTSITGKRFFRAKITNLSICENSSWFSNWIRQKILASTSQVVIGDLFRGGIVFFTSGTGQGLISPLEDQGIYTWGCMGTDIPGASYTTNGMLNTAAISSNCNDYPYAASVCDTLRLNSYFNWFLPSIDELQSLRQQRIIVGNFATDFYWSSTQVGQDDAYRKWFQDGSQGYVNKDLGFHVRCIRPFSASDDFEHVINNVIVTDQPLTVNFISEPQDTSIFQGNNITLSVGVTGTPPFFYQWKKDGVVLPGETNSTYTINSFSSANEGSYTCMVANLCRVLESSPAFLSSMLMINSTNVPSSCGNSNGSIMVNPSGGVGPYTYLWSTSATSQTLTNLAAGHYYVTVSDSNGNVNFDYIILNDAVHPNIVISSQTNSCSGYCNGTALLSSTGGIGPYTYQWMSGGATNFNGVLCPGSTFVTVTDANTCRAVAEISTLEFTQIVATNSVNNNVSCNGLHNGSATINVSGGSPGYIYTWPDGTSTQNHNLLGAGVYVVTITDANNCSTATNVTITENPVLTVAISGSSNIICALNCSGTALAVASGGTGNYSYLWNDPFPYQTTASATNLCAGNYTVTVSDGNNCTATVSVGISENPPVEATVTNNNLLICYGQCNGNANVNVSGGVFPYSYHWNDPGNHTTATITGLCAGNYQVTVTDAVGCVDVASMNVNSFSPYSNQQLCIITVDTITWKNKIMWEKTLGVGSEFYLVYKETGTNSYTQIGNVLSTQPAEYVDLFSVPESHGDKYKISILDTCGNESDMSFYHKTMNLTIAAFGSTMGLNWDDYVDESGTYAPFRYYIYRGLTPTSMSLHDSVSGSFNSYNDVNVFNVYYYIIGVKKTGSCNTTKSDFISFSNKKDNSTLLGINTPTYGTITLSPNPFSEQTTIEIPNFHLTNDNVSMAIYDVTGKIVRIVDLSNNQASKSSDYQIKIDKGDLKAGVYFVEVKGERIYRGKLIVE